MNRFFTFSLILPAAIAAGASINAPSPGGHLDRGILMLRQHNPQGALDQLMHTAPGLYSAPQAAQAAFGEARATLLDGRPAEARTLFEAFVRRYPASLLTLPAMMGVADCLFYEEEYQAALDAYEAIDPAALDSRLGTDHAYRSAFCEMMLGRYTNALQRFEALRADKRYADAATFYAGYANYALGHYDRARTLLEEADSSAPPGDHAPYYLAQVAYAQGRYDEALTLARDHMDYIPAYTPELKRVAGESLYMMGEPAEAMPYLDSYVSSEADPEASALYMLGVGLYRDGEWQQAVETLRKVASDRDAMGQSAYLYIGQACLQLGQMNPAVMALEQAYRMDYDRNVKETAFYNYAVARSQGGRTPFGSSVAIFETFLRDFPDSRYAPEVREYLVTGYLTDNNYEQALEAIDRTPNPTPQLMGARQRVLFMLGTRQLASSHPSQALKLFREAASIKGGDGAVARECNLWTGDCLYRLGDFKGASMALRNYLREVPRGENTALANYDLGYCQFALKDYAAARASFEKALDTGTLPAPMAADAHNRAGDCLYYTSDFAGASERYDRALALNPAVGDYATYQKAMMRGFARDYRGKIELLDRIPADYPSSGLIPAAMLQKAETLVALNRHDDAVAVYRRLIAAYPGTAQGRNGHLQLAVTLLGRGERQLAIATYKDVVRNYPTSEEARVASDDLKRLLAEDGRLGEYTKFLTTVPGAPALEADELDALTFEAAEKAYLADAGATGRLKEYLSTYPSGIYAPHALAYLAGAARATGDTDGAERYARDLTTRFPDTEQAEEGLAILGECQLGRGETRSALETFTRLEKHASVPRTLNAARMGLLKAALATGRNDEAVAAADRALASSELSTALRLEASLLRGKALAAAGRSADAVKAWEPIASHTDDISGAEAALLLAEYRYNAGNLKQARKAAESLIDSNTPHSYWLARGYIVLSDILRRQGNTFEADEYLKSLRENYPGKEADIKKMIAERLNKSKK